LRPLWTGTKNLPISAWYHRNCVRILFIGDIFGRPGRTIVRERLRNLVREQRIDLVLANGENSAAGFGITPAYKMVDTCAGEFP